MFAENFNTAEGYGLYGGFNSVFVCDDGISVAKQVDFPNGWTDDTNLSFKVLFKNGHNCADASTPMTLNGVAVVVNKYGTLIPLPIHEMDDSGTPIYKSLQPNTILEMYYTNDYDGADTPAYVVIGNPIVLSSTDYTIYANGQSGQMVPDYASGSIYTSASTSYTMPCNGFINFTYIGQGGVRALIIDGVKMSYEFVSYGVSSFSGFVSKGSVITLEGGGTLDVNGFKVFKLIPMTV